MLRCKSLRTSTHMFLVETTTTISRNLPSATTACPRCGAKNDSGKSSCCGRGGSWFKNCGPPGDKDVDHTWLEGIEACERKLMITFEINMY